MKHQTSIYHNLTDIAWNTAFIFNRIPQLSYKTRTCPAQSKVPTSIWNLPREPFGTDTLTGTPLLVILLLVQVTCNALPPTQVETNSFMSKSRPEEGQVHMLLHPWQDSVSSPKPYFYSFWSCHGVWTMWNQSGLLSYFSLSLSLDSNLNELVLTTTLILTV